MRKMTNVRISRSTRLPSPRKLAKEFPMLEKVARNIIRIRRNIANVLVGKSSSDKILIIVGPCSVHCPVAAYEYAKKLSVLAKRVQGRITIMMRVCGDKPRTSKAWPGYMFDPRLDGSFDMVSGYREMTKLMSKITELGLPIATEALHRAAFNVVSRFISYAWIGARTIADPEKRDMASGLSMPVGMKNPDHGPLKTAINAIDYARCPGVFEGPDDNNVVSINRTKGNSHPHLILRGSSSGPNHCSESVRSACEMLKDAGLIDRLIIDCSHGNAEGNYQKQIAVAHSVVDQIIAGETGIAGLMIESYLLGGKQKDNVIGTPEGAQNANPRQSQTDACLSWEDTEKLILDIYEKLGDK